MDEISQVPILIRIEPAEDFVPGPGAVVNVFVEAGDFRPWASRSAFPMTGLRVIRLMVAPRASLPNREEPGPRTISMRSSLLVSTVLKWE